MIDVSFEGRILRLDGRTVSMPHEVQDAFSVNDTVVVLLEPDADLGKSGQFRNLLALDSGGAVLWHAELPTDQSSDVFTRIVSRLPLRADSFSSFECEIDLRTGRLLATTFFK